MATAQLLPNVNQTWTDANGAPLNGGLLYSYIAGTTTPQATYTNQGALTPNTNPVVLNSSGQASVWLRTDLTYKLVMKDSAGVTQWTADNVKIVNAGSITSLEVDSSLAGVGLAKNVSTKAFDIQLDNVTIDVNASNQIEVKDASITNAKLSGSIDGVTKLLSTVEVVPKNVRNDYGFRINLVPQFPWSSPTKLASPGTLPTGQVNVVRWSPSGEFVAVGHSTTPFITIYQRTGSTFTKLTNPATLPAGTVKDLAWSPNGDFLAVGHSISPFITIYQRSGTTFTKLADPASIPVAGASGFVQTVSWSPNGDFLSITSEHSPAPISIGFIIYYRTGATFTDITGTSGIVTTNIGLGFACWSPDSSLFSIADGTHASGFLIYQRTEKTFTAITEPATSQVPSLAQFSPNGDWLALIVPLTPFILIYAVSGTVFTIQANPATLPPEQADSLAWSQNSKLLALGHPTTPYMFIYSRSASTFTKLSDLGTVPDGRGFSCDFSPSTKFLAMASGTLSPFIDFYQTAGTIAANAIPYIAEINDV